jgi:hypothetical protein
MEWWQNKIRRVCCFLRGWAKNLVSKQEQKTDLLAKIDVLDRKAETCLLSPQENDLRHHLKGQLTKLLREEVIYWLQQSKATRLLKGMINSFGGK